MTLLTFVASALALASYASAAAAPANKLIQFNVGSYPTPSCLAVSQNVAGNQAVIGNCDASDPEHLSNPLARAWTVVKGGSTSGTGPASAIFVYKNLCLDVKGGGTSQGTPVQAYTCYSGNTNQMWNVNADNTITWAKDHTKCLDLDGRHGLTVLNTCDKNAPFQKWIPNEVVPWPVAPKNMPVRFQISDKHDYLQDNTGNCITVKDAIKNGAVVNSQPCGNVDTVLKSWTVTNGGARNGNGPSSPIKVGGDSCLDVVDGKDANGSKLQVWKCYEGSKNQQFSVNGDGSIKWLGGNNKCVDLTDGDEAGQKQLQIWTCGSSNYNQKWIPFPLPVTM